MSSVLILHFNDVYNIEPQRDEPVGGASRFAGYIHSCRHENPLVLFSGDVLNPSLMSIFMKGEQMIPVMNGIGVRCALYGNHDFDFGVDHLQEVAKSTTFPWLLSNVQDNLSQEPLALGEVTQMLEWNGIKIGLVGLVEEEWIETLATLDPDDVTYIDFVDEGKRLANILRNQGADIVIALTHMRWPNDIHLAESVDEIDLILGGHDHDYDTKVVNGKYIVKSGTDFRNLSRVMISRDVHGWCVDVERVDIDSSVPEDPLMKEIVNEKLGQVESKMDTYLGDMGVELEGRFSRIRSQETNLGNFVTDIMLTATKADVAILNSGTFRSDRVHPRGRFTIRDLLTILPMVDPLIVIKVTGDKLLKALENGVSQYPVLEGRFPQIAGVVFGFDPSLPPGQRIDPELVKVQGHYMVLDREYTLCTKEYMYFGKDGYGALSDSEIVVSSEQCQALSTTVQNHFESVQIHLGQLPCKSGHRQSLISLSRKDIIVLRAGLKNKKPWPLVRQNSIHAAENEMSFLCPKVDGRIFIINEEKRQIMLALKPSFNSEQLCVMSEEFASGSTDSMNSEPDS
ncbi:mannosylglucosyl-3-phosphoglycerate phosphatase-like [Gigantopelta aegis]|uniref:mannosylglucosyl-3-phosphoglycerate phosphatase-like n=1 Tax=Gigantopelta aegis TaxID=1735272 RepID=UPI001B88E4FE|nr:mannosylglucosyl-3-phosphoglycerate phosphatase-like [Gigantopelta aegis]